ncbi:kinesin-like protein KIF18B [Neocloeon triangulifer]|uniref:kinesin-like protein KIF18B n=1 Tax=Neocloeon triangulifer TaxID=2078957 RepID=UPI00286F5B6A|nr:kinesin-like protein KIF18B [Neocloeon triangulifer]
MFGRVIKKASPRKRKSLTMKHGTASKRLSNVGLLATPSAKGSATCSSNIKVLLRVRPSSRKELDDNRWRDVVEVVDKDLVIFDPKEEEDFFFHHGKKQAFRDINKKQPKNLQFNFDQVFGSEESTAEVYQKSIQGLIYNLMNGYNCSVFAYGATGAGKTFTMLGTPEAPGITPLLMKELYDTLQQENADVDVAVSYLEIYNEMVHDLLVETNPPKQLQLRDDGACVIVSDLSWHRPATADQLMSILQAGNLRRTQHPTDANKESSRSHAVFQVLVKMKKRSDTGGRSGQVRCAKLSMIDLAGSERAAATTNNKCRFAEGANINKSLLALGNCINALADGLKHVPFRNSKLTRLLKGSLGGNCQTVMIANVSPSSAVYEDTYNTLKYATRAKKIKNRVKKNLISVDITAAETARELDSAKAEIARLQAQNAALRAENDSLKLAAKEHVCAGAPVVVEQPVVTVVQETPPPIQIVQELPTPEPSPKPASPAVEEQKNLEILEMLRALRESCKQFETAAATKYTLVAELDKLEYNYDIKKLKFQRINELSKEGTQIKESSHEIKVKAQRINLEQKLEEATLEEQRCFETIKLSISSLQQIDSTIFNLANIMLNPYCEGKEKELRFATCSKLSVQKSTEIETIQSAFLKCASVLHKCFFTLKGLCCVSPELQAQFDELLSYVRQSGSVKFKSADEEDEVDSALKKSDEDFDNFMDEFEQELLARPLDQTFNAEPKVVNTESMDATFCVENPSAAKKSKFSPPRRPMEAPFRVKPYSGGFKKKPGTPMRSAFRNKLKMAGGSASSAARIAKPVQVKKFVTNKENDPA